MSEKLQRAGEHACYQMNSEEWMAEKFSELNRAGSQYLLVSVNIKNFKYLNLEYGWDAGNEFLYGIYKAMEKQLEADEYIAQMRGDSFGLLLHKQMWEMAEDPANAFIATVIMKYVDAVFEVSDSRIYKNIYASFGIYPIYIKQCDFYEALETAELFRQEDAGIRHRTFTVNYYTDDAYARFMQKYHMGKSTANALPRGEYQVYIQPKVELKTRRIAGGEALLRRFDATGKPIPLSEFLPILNAEGYIRKIDWFVFETACEVLGARMAEGKPIAPISFNISRDFFYDVFMCENYIKTREKFNVPQEYIEFELMETISLDDTGRMVEMIEMFKAAGFKCSLDDFGNGYSSFGVLLNADLDYVKLDRIFFKNPLDEANRRIIKSVVDILKFLGFKIVAEGVETQEYVDYLAELGCDLIQGFYFYRPMPMADFLQLLDEQEQNEKSKGTNI